MIEAGVVAIAVTAQRFPSGSGGRLFLLVDLMDTEMSDTAFGESIRESEVAVLSKTRGYISLFVDR